ncbi:MAG: MOSC domain-containing protein [Chromatiales bacterium]|jgi:MOSC domain-containing protein YiiM
MSSRLGRKLAPLLGRRPGPGRLERIYLAPRAGAPMAASQAAQVLRGRGLAGDRYAEGRGFYRATDACQLTLIGAEALERIQARTGIALLGGEHRRNLVVRALEPEALKGRRLRIGTVLFEYHRPRPPCGYLERLTAPGMVKALVRHPGVCLRALEDGLIRVGDPVVPD